MSRYTLAQTAHNRIALAARAACQQYFREHPDGQYPGERFFAEYLAPFIDLELEKRSLEDLQRERAKKELELITKVSDLMQVCANKIGPWLTD